MEALPTKALEGLKRQDGKVTYYLLADLAREVNLVSKPRT